MAIEFMIPRGIGRARPWNAWSVFVLALLCAVPSASAQTGTIVGSVTTSAPRTAPMRVTIDQKVCGDELPDESVIVGPQGQLANAVITIVGLTHARVAEAMVTNDKCRFVPRVQVVRPNALIKTSSKDAVVHTTQAQLTSGRVLFNVALPVPGVGLTKGVGATGPVRLSCQMHPWMRGWLFVTDDTAAVSGADGRFTLEHVPPGTYDVRVWHEALVGVPQKVTVTAGKPTQISFALK